MNKIFRLGYIVQRTTEEVRTQIQHLKDSAVRRVVGAADTTAALYGMHLAAHRLVAAERRRARGSANQRLMETLRRTVHEDPDRAELLIDEQLCPHFQSELLPLLIVQHERSEQDLTEAVNSVERSLTAADTQRWILTLAAAASAILIGLFMSRSIGRPLAMLQRAAQEVGRGRFETRVTVGLRNEIGDLGHALNQMAADLQERTVSKSYLENIIHVRGIVQPGSAELTLSGTTRDGGTFSGTDMVKVISVQAKK